MQETPPPFTKTVCFSKQEENNENKKLLPKKKAITTFTFCEIATAASRTREETWELTKSMQLPFLHQVGNYPSKSCNERSTCLQQILFSICVWIFCEFFELRLLFEFLYTWRRLLYFLFSFAFMRSLVSLWKGDFLRLRIGVLKKKLSSFSILQSMSKPKWTNSRRCVCLESIYVLSLNFLLLMVIVAKSS